MRFFFISISFFYPSFLRGRDFLVPALRVRPRNAEMPNFIKWFSIVLKFRLAAPLLIKRRTPEDIPTRSGEREKNLNLLFRS
ncbi:MAG: hypothetical protein BWK80_00975 [Desulfobacteraceae bacterium IS3]|nr:MAG: hypothetical protein BWK80_00975 [Desulfobacteraceae bacterium IS3]